MSSMNTKLIGLCSTIASLLIFSNGQSNTLSTCGLSQKLIDRGYQLVGVHHHADFSSDLREPAPVIVKKKMMLAPYHTTYYKIIKPKALKKFVSNKNNANKPGRSKGEYYWGIVADYDDDYRIVWELSPKASGKGVRSSKTFAFADILRHVRFAKRDSAGNEEDARYVKTKVSCGGTPAEEYYATYVSEEMLKIIVGVPQEAFKEIAGWSWATPSQQNTPSRFPLYIPVFIHKLMKGHKILVGEYRHGHIFDFQYAWCKKEVLLKPGMRVGDMYAVMNPPQLCERMFTVEKRVKRVEPEEPTATYKKMAFQYKGHLVIDNQLQGWCFDRSLFLTKDERNIIEREKGAFLTHNTGADAVDKWRVIESKRISELTENKKLGAAISLPCAVGIRLY